MRLASLAFAGALVACGNSSAPSMQIIAPEQLSDAIVLERSDVVLVVSPSAVLATDKVRLLAPDTYAVLAEVTGDAVWAGRTSWQESVVRVHDPEAGGMVLARADNSDKLVVTPPADASWRFAFFECGSVLCSITWRDDANKQFVDVVDMKTLTKVASYAREVAAHAGVADPSRDIVYHADNGLRVVAEDQRTGKLVWTRPLDPPSTRREFKFEEHEIKLSARGRYVLSVYGWFRGAFQRPELAVFDASSGTPVPIDQGRFRKIVDGDAWIDPVPGTDDIMVSSLLIRAGESPDVGLTALEQLSLPSLTTIKEHHLPNDDRLRKHAPGQVLPLVTGRVLLAGR